MRILFAVVLLSYTALVLSETCSDQADCSLILCNNNATVICERGECTCLVEVTTMPPVSTGDRNCTTLTDCMGLPHCHGDGTHGPQGVHGHEWHCIDGVCRCAGFHP